MAQTETRSSQAASQSQGVSNFYSVWRWRFNGSWYAWAYIVNEEGFDAEAYHEAIGYEEEPCNRKECKACRIWYGAERSA